MLWAPLSDKVAKCVLEFAHGCHRARLHLINILYIARRLPPRLVSHTFNCSRPFYSWTLHRIKRAFFIILCGGPIRMWDIFLSFTIRLQKWLWQWLYLLQIKRHFFSVGPPALQLFLSSSAYPHQKVIRRFNCVVLDWEIYVTIQTPFALFLYLHMATLKHVCK